MHKFSQNYSQYAQDIFPYIYTKDQTPFYVEVGAYYPFIHSDSAFEEQKGWKGICVEPDPDKLSNFKNVRKCKLLNFAISGEEGDMDYLSADGLSALLSTLTESQLERIKKEKANYKINIVKIKPFNTIGNYLKKTKIDFLSIDVEGHEKKVLESIDFFKYKINLLTIEVAVNNKKEIRRILKKNGFKLIFTYHSDGFYINERYHSKFSFFEKIKKFIYMYLVFFINDFRLIYKKCQNRIYYAAIKRV